MDRLAVSRPTADRNDSSSGRGEPYPFFYGPMGRQIDWLINCWRRFRRKRTATAVAAVLGATLVVAAVIRPDPTPDYSPPPGALNPAVTQSTIHTTVCVHGWTATIRPSSRYMSPIERQMIEDRHLPGTTGDYELDHFIPLGIGGAPRDPANLWPQRWPQAHAKDFAEVRLLHALCAGTITLADARIQIADPVNWHKGGSK